MPVKALDTTIPVPPASMSGQSTTIVGNSQSPLFQLLGKRPRMSTASQGADMADIMRLRPGTACQSYLKRRKRAGWIWTCAPGDAGAHASRGRGVRQRLVPPSLHSRDGRSPGSRKLRARNARHRTCPRFSSMDAPGCGVGFGGRDGEQMGAGTRISPSHDSGFFSSSCRRVR